MSSVTCQMSISLDGFVAGPDQSPDNPIGIGGMALHKWHLGDEFASDADREMAARLMSPRGAYVMGRNMFGPIRGEHDPDWRGWWGDEPPYHTPVFVLSHHARKPLSMRGGTTFNFVTEGIESALTQARSAAGDKDVAIAGGARTVQQYLAAGLLDELYLHIVPVILGTGERLVEGVGDPTLEPVKVIASPAVTHVEYRIVRPRRR